MSAVFARPANKAIFCVVQKKVNLGLDNNTWGGGFSKYCLVPGEILEIHRHALWEIPQNGDYEEAAVLDPICNAYNLLLSNPNSFPARMSWFSALAH